MFVETVTTVTIDPVEEFEILQKYKESPNWRCIHESTICYIFERSTGLIKLEAPVFLNELFIGDEGGDDG